MNGEITVSERIVGIYSRPGAFLIILFVSREMIVKAAGRLFNRVDSIYADREENDRSSRQQFPRSWTVKTFNAHVNLIFDLVLFHFLNPSILSPPFLYLPLLLLSFSQSFILPFHVLALLFHAIILARRNLEHAEQRNIQSWMSDIVVETVPIFKYRLHNQSMLWIEQKYILIHFLTQERIVRKSTKYI